jgi:integrase
MFCHPNGDQGDPGKPIGNFQKQFRPLLNEVGLHLDEDGNERCLYSCRHTYATFRISEGNVDIFQLATNMGCSVEILQAHYAHIIPE